MEIKAARSWRAFSSFQRADESGVHTALDIHTYLSYRYTNSEALWFTWNKNNEWEDSSAAIHYLT